MIDEGTLRQLAREAIHAESLPNRPPTHIWGGNGFGTRCAICSNLVNPDEVGYELQFAADEDLAMDAIYHVHVRCFAAWELERRSPLPTDAQGVTIAHRERLQKRESP